MFCKMILLLQSDLPFLQIQNKDNGDIALLAPPCPWRQRKCFAVVAANATCSNGSRLAMNDERTRWEEGGLVCTPVSSLLMMNCVICRRASVPSSLARQRRFIAAALIAIYQNGSRPVVVGEIIGGGGAGLLFEPLAHMTRNTTINPWGLCNTDNLLSGLALG